MFHRIHLRDPRIRALPYPFQGALAISNDIEYFSFEFFEALMAFLNTTRNTSLGAGLGLEVTSSFFFYSAHPYNFSYFAGADWQSHASPQASRIEDYLRAGWIDTNHAYGGFDEVGGFRREHAERCYETLARVSVALRVFTNHGDAANIQNVGTDAAYHRGDVLESPAYHADLMAQNGVRYVWTDSMTSKKEPSMPALAIAASPPKRWRWTRPAQKDPSMDSNVTSAALPGSLLNDCVLQDGSRFKGVTRFRSTGNNAPNFSSLGYQVRQIDWADFYASSGVVVMYQHLGVLHRHAQVCSPATVDAVRARPEIYLSPLYFLAQEQKEGRLWVCGLSKLLNYVDAVQTVQLEQGEGNNYYLRYGQSAIADPAAFFQGLTLYIDTTKPFRLLFNDYELPVSHNGPDETGKYSVTIPLQKPDNIW